MKFIVDFLKHSWSLFPVMAGLALILTHVGSRPHLVVGLVLLGVGWWGVCRMMHRIAARRAAELEAREAAHG